MNHQVRISVFETNSSSSHSLTLGKGNLVRPPVSQEVLRSGVLEIGLGKFGWDYEVFQGLESKLEYLVTQVASELDVHHELEGSDEAYAKLLADPRMTKLSEVVAAYVGVKLEVLRRYGYVDHQSVGLCNELFEDDAKLHTFLFDPQSSVTTDNDNHYDYAD